MLEAICARTIAEAEAAGDAGLYAAISDRPGLPRALLRSFSELRLAGCEPGPGLRVPPALSGLFSSYLNALAEANLVDRAGVLKHARHALTSGTVPVPVFFLDPEVGSPSERSFLVAALGSFPESALAIPSQDSATRQAVELAFDEGMEELDGGSSGSLGRLQRFLFAEASPPSDPGDDSVLLFSAPGEDRECVEVVRRIQKAAAEGTAYDRMAVLLRRESTHRAELEEAFRRGGIPAFYASGRSLPDPSARAFLVLLACRAEGLSVHRFCEYLSLRQLGKGVQHRAWERLLNDSRAIGGLERIVRRVEIHEDPLREEQLTLLRSIGLSLLRELASLPDEDSWQGWATRLQRLATTSTEDPSPLLPVLMELGARSDLMRPSLDEVRVFLSRRLGERRVAPEHRVHGAVFVGSTDNARGRSFERVYVLGLAEGVFPEKVVEDPVLLDAARRGLGCGLATNADRAKKERFALQLAAGAAEQQLVLSWARLDAQAGRPRVPSFYALEAMRAARGLLPSYEVLAAEADSVGSARMGWPAPADPSDAVDSAEHDLALFHRVRRRPESEARGTMRYLLAANPHLGRSLRARARRWDLPVYNPADGLVQPRTQGLEAIAKHSLGRRSFSASALQDFAQCPYRFFLSAIHGLKPREEARPLEYLDRRARGKLMHEVQFEFLSRMREGGRLPIHSSSLPDAMNSLSEVIEEVASLYFEELAPAIERVWLDSVAAVQTDLREWVRRLAAQDRWVPRQFELSFGLSVSEGRDAASISDPVLLDSGLSLRGSIDLVEADSSASIRVTDYKAGRAVVPGGSIVRGGTSLQPLLYALAAEKMFPEETVEAGRLDYCTTQGQFREVVVPLRPEGRRAAELLTRVLSSRLDRGSFPAVPRADACERCDYRRVCGPHEEFRIRRKDASAIADLIELRGLR